MSLLIAYIDHSDLVNIATMQSSLYIFPVMQVESFRLYLDSPFEETWSIKELICNTIAS